MAGRIGNVFGGHPEDGQIFLNQRRPLMMKKIMLTCVLLLPAAVFVMPDAAPAQSKSTMNIRFSTWHLPVGREVKTVWIPMLEELKKRSEGRITYTLFAGSALGSGPEHYDIVAKGLSDMGYFTATWTPGRFPLSDVLSMAASVNGKDVGTDIGNAMYERILKQEFPGVKMIELNGCIQAFMWTRKPVKTLEDVKGLRIRSPGGHQTNYIKALGAEPVFMPVGDVYLSMETGTIDGIVTCPPLIISAKLFEVAKYATIATFGCVTEGVIMNEKSWQNTPDDLKPIIMEVCKNPFRTTGGLNADVYGTMVKELEEAGVQFHKISAEQEKQWFAMFQEETRKWVDGLEAKGLPAKEVVKAYYEIAQKHGVEAVAFPPEYAQ
jgi:TRAP-type transport system periplasmic protein